jgi:hypothetical protein
MTNPQLVFDNVISLLSTANHNAIAEELINYSFTEELTFNTTKSNKKHLTKIYSNRQMMQGQRQEKFVKGFEQLIPALETTYFDDIRISSIVTETGTYVIFTDINLTSYIGILKSNRTLTEVRDKYSEHAEAVRKYGSQPIYDYEESETIFIKGKFIK